MEMLDRYLQAIRRHLPWLGQDDIVAELKANLEGQLEDKEAELGRKLTDAEMEAWLKQLGSPLQVAARYQPQQFLIGPALFPTYWYVLRLVLMWCAAIYTVTNVIETVVGGAGMDGLARALAHLPWSLFVTAALTTLIFAIVERSGAKLPEKLARGEVMGNDWPHTPVARFDEQYDTRNKPKTYAQAVLEVIVRWIVLVWLLLVPHYPYLLMGPGVVLLKVSPYQLAPVWWWFYWCIVVLNAVELAWHSIDLLRERWRGPHPVQHLVKHLLGLIPMLAVLTAPGRVLLALKNPADVAHAAALAQLNDVVYHGFEVIAAIVVLQLVWMMGRMGFEGYRKRLAAQ